MTFRHCSYSLESLLMTKNTEGFSYLPWTIAHRYQPQPDVLDKFGENVMVLWMSQGSHRNETMV